MSSAYALDVQEVLSAAAEDAAARAFALVDAAQDPGLAARLREAPNEAACLYSGAPPDLEAVAPWLVDLGDACDGTTSTLLTEGWGKAWVSLLLSSASLDELRKHFRGFLLVSRETDGKELYFRFYDPRVLRVYLPTASPEELATVFGPVQAFILESRDPASAWRYERDAGGGLVGTSLDLQGAPA